MKIRLHLYILGVLIIVGLIVGSFCDLQIAKTLFSDRNGFGIIIASFGLLIGYGVVTFFGALLFRTTLGGNKPRAVKIIIYIFAFGSIVVAAYFSQKEMFSVNGLNMTGVGYTVLAWCVSLLVQGVIFYLAFRFTKNYKNDRFWIVTIMIWLVVIISLVAGTTLLKNVIHRPRYRTVQLNIEGLNYHNWWEPFKDYKNYIVGSITSEEFKSFPSGHAGVSFLVISLAVFLPYIFPMKKRTQLIVFYVSVIYFLVVCFSRLLVGAHFLSDVSMGALLPWVFTYIAFEISVRNKLICIQ